VQGLALHNRSEAYRELGQYVSAKATAEEALTLVRAAGYRVGEANALENLALIEFALGERERALEHAQAALTITCEIAARRVEASVLIRIGQMRLEMGQLDAAEQSFHESQKIEQELQEPIPMFEIQAGLAGVCLARGGAESLEMAQARVQSLVEEILQEPPTEQSHILPLWLHWMAIRALQSRNDPRTAQLIVRANAELRARSEKITAADLRVGYENIPEHHAIINFTNQIGGRHE
jgi:tetratricopeptide (TPR) repeat protein